MPQLKTFGSTPDNAGKSVDVTTEHGYPTGVKRQNGRLLTKDEVGQRTIELLEEISSKLTVLIEVASNIR